MSKDSQSSEERFESLLVAYDRRLAGEAPADDEAPPLVPDLAARLKRAQAALDLLAKVRGTSHRSCRQESTVDLVLERMLPRLDRGDLQGFEESLERSPELRRRVCRYFEQDDGKFPDDQAHQLSTAEIARAERGEEFAGTERFRIDGRLGAGGMGVVYRAFDRWRQETVALKVLHERKPEAVARLSHEFRALADVRHPNVIALYELHEHRGLRFFTMELIEGRDFLAYMRQGFSAALQSAEQFERLQSALSQLADGLSALHDAGRLHRDIKPANVLITNSGRVVLLDFGLAADLDAAGTAGSYLAGTAPYMSPEQAARQPLTAASDWYNVGTMLFEALSGRLPYRGSVQRIMAAKRFVPPPDITELAPAAPPKLLALCRALLHRKPDARPTAAAVRAALVESHDGHTLVTPLAAVHRATFVGRQPQLEVLKSAFERVTRGEAIWISLSGCSGVGKSSLVRHFLAGLPPEKAQVLEARCHEREWVPFKAADGFINELAASLERRQAALLDADRITAAARLFPALAAVLPTALPSATAAHLPRDGVLDRREGLSALRLLFERLSTERPIVVFVDDLQWGDADSAALYAELLRPPNPPRLLVVACCRREEAPASAFLTAMEALRRPFADSGSWIELTIAPLNLEESRLLAEQLLDGEASSEAGCQAAAAIARESGGLPYFIHELVEQRAAFDRSDRAVLDAPCGSLDEAIWRRVCRLPDGPRRLLQVLAVAGRPMPQSIARQAAGLSADDSASLAMLRAKRLIDTRIARLQERIQPYHDRIREAIVARLSAGEMRECHQRLASALAAARDHQPEALMVHYEDAGDFERAAECAVLSAERANRVLAFDLAASYYRAALRLGAVHLPQQRKLRRDLAEALGNCGRSAEAADEYLAAVDETDVAEAGRLKGRAAEQLFFSGQYSAGFRATAPAFKFLGMRPPRPSDWRTLLRLIFHRLRLACRGYRYRAVDSSEVPTDDLARLDLLYLTASPLWEFDGLLGAELMSRATLMALRLGEPVRLAQALMQEAAVASHTDGRSRRRARRLIAEIERLAEQTHLDSGRRMADMAHGMLSLMQGEWRASLARWNEVHRRRQLDRATHALDTQAHLLAMICQFYLGDVLGLSRRVHERLAAAIDRGDRNDCSNLRIHIGTTVWLATDSPTAAREQIGLAMSSWPDLDVPMQRLYALYGQLAIDLYLRDSLSAGTHANAAWRLLNKSGLARVQYLRIEAASFCARAALLAEHDQRGRRDARRFAARLRREGLPWACAQAELIYAAVLAAEGNRSLATDGLKEAAERFARLDMALHAAAAQRARGLFIGGEEGQRLVASADSWMTRQLICNPARMAAMIAPGIWNP